MKNTLIYAFVIGLYERARYLDGFGRTHATNQDWNIWYDRGANVADFFMGVK